MKITITIENNVPNVVFDDELLSITNDEFFCCTARCHHYAAIYCIKSVP